MPSNPIIAVHGATGFTGRLVAAELARRGIAAVLVGRDADRLGAVAASPGSERRIASVDDPPALVAALRDCAAVINCAGPFSTLGAPVVRAALDAGVHYMDISGEQQHVLRVFDDFGEQAERAGVTVVPMVNDGGFLADLLVAVTATAAEPVETVVIAHRTVGEGGLSRGSGRTAVLSREMFAGGGLVHVDGRWRADLPADRATITFPGETRPSRVGKAGFAEIATVPRHVRAKRVEGVAETGFLAALATVTPELVEQLPEAPPEDRRRSVRFTVVAEVSGGAGRARGVLDGADTYGTSAVVAVEAASRLVAHGAEPGVLAPAQAFPAADVLDSLVPHGVRYTVRTG